MDIEKLLNEMTTEEKLCQMTQMPRECVYSKKSGEGVVGMTAKQCNAIGSVLAYSADFDARKDIDEHLKNDPHKIPLMIMLDIIHGYKTAFPIPLALGASFDTELAEKCCEYAAEEASEDGISVTFSPMVDLARDARWGRVMETASEDAYLNGEFGKAMIRGYHKGGLACCVKHFAAYGGAEGGRDYNSVDMSEHTLREYYLRAYKECLKERPEMIMTSFNTLNGVPSTANRRLIADILRREWGFDGVVITDYGAVNEMIAHGFKEDARQSAKAALTAGIDVEMCTSSFIENGAELVADGEIDIKTIDNATRRIINLKDKLGLFENPYYKYSDKHSRTIEEGRELTRKAAEEACVLLKNSGVLPLKKEESVFLAGPFSDTKEIVGNWCAFCDKDATVTIKSGIEQLLGRKIASMQVCGGRWNDRLLKGIRAAKEAARKADKIIVCVGEHQDETGECRSKTDIRLSSAQRRLIKELSGCGKSLIGVVFAGRPLVLSDVTEYFDALVYVWQPGTEGGNAIANVLYGNVNPSGKLPVSLPRSVGQCPLHYDSYSTGRPNLTDAGFFVGTSCYIDEATSPLYPFGYGLSYTRFELSEPVLSVDKIRRGEKAEVKTNLKNTGNDDGTEVVQLYIRDNYSEPVRPIKQLKGFKRVFLKSGECREISFEICEETLSFYADGDKPVLQKGKFTVYLGTSSDNIKGVTLESV
ncbi:MAG: glycoside hydrolase family 3 C-terminal domain-containing protein [Clostridia bacterium]|nr:glycoside hydrolase family 3 C-terminal domain-containing protein [Clostridia bacterium]